MHIFQDLKQLLDNSKLYLLRWADEYTDLVQGGFQELFTNLVGHFHFLCVRSAKSPLSSDKSQSAQTVAPSLVLLVSLLSVYLHQTAVPQITEVSISFCPVAIFWLFEWYLWRLSFNITSCHKDTTFCFGWKSSYKYHTWVLFAVGGDLVSWWGCNGIWGTSSFRSFWDLSIF